MPKFMKTVKTENNINIQRQGASEITYSDGILGSL